MNHRAVALIAVFFGLNFAPLAVRASPSEPLNPNARSYKYQDLLGKDVAGTDWKSQQDSADDPETRISDQDSTNTVALQGFSESHLDSLFGSNSSPSANPAKSGSVKIESTKPIEKVEPRGVTESFAPQPASAAVGKSDGRRILLIALVAVAIFAYRKFRRARAAVSWHKPGYL